MAEVPLPTPTDNAVPSTDIRDAVYAGAMLDKVVTSTEPTYIDRLGGEHYTVDGIKAEGDKVVEETRQNLIPLSRQYMTLAAAQADIANIPEGSTTYYRSPDDSALAIEVINNAGTLQPTGRKMPSNQAVELLRGLIDNLGVNPFSVVFKNGLSPLGYKNGRLYADEFEKVYSSNSGIEFGGSIIDNNPPDGWIFIIYYRNGLVLCGQKTDGTIVGLVTVAAVAARLSLAIRRLITIPFATTQARQLCVTSSASILPAGSWLTLTIRHPLKSLVVSW